MRDLRSAGVGPSPRHAHLPPRAPQPDSSTRPVLGRPDIRTPPPPAWGQKPRSPSEPPVELSRSPAVGPPTADLVPSTPVSGDAAAAELSPTFLGQRLREAIRRRHYSVHTEHAYLGWLARFLAFHGMRDPTQMGASEVQAFLTHLAMSGKVSASTQNQAFSALIFLYRDVLKRELTGLEDTPRAKGPVRLPVVLSREEVKAILGRLGGTLRLIASLMYGSGLRLQECLQARIKDIDFSRRGLVVRDGKGQKDRETMLPKSQVEILREHIKKAIALHERDLAAGNGSVLLPGALGRKYPRAAWETAWQWVFPASRQYVNRENGRLQRYHVHETVVQRAFREAARLAGITKHATCHSLRSVSAWYPPFKDCQSSTAIGLVRQRGVGVCGRDGRPGCAPVRLAAASRCA